MNYVFALECLSETAQSQITKIIISVLFGVIMYSIYIEYAIGSVLFRRNDENNLVLSKSILLYYIAPFRDKHMWTYEFIDLNSVLFITMTSLMFYLNSFHLKNVSILKAWEALY